LQSDHQSAEKVWMD